MVMISDADKAKWWFSHRLKKLPQTVRMEVPSQ